MAVLEVIYELLKVMTGGQMGGFKTLKALTDGICICWWCLSPNTRPKGELPAEGLTDGSLWGIWVSVGG